MSDFFLGQIMMTGFGFAPKGWAMCNGQIMSIAQSQALFSLLGVTYGGNGVTTFALPDLRSRTPAGAVISADSGWSPPQYVPGEVAGTENVTLMLSQLPTHNHPVNATTAAGTDVFGSATTTFATSTPTGVGLYGSQSPSVPLTAGPLTPAGGNQPHANLQPFETINFNIALSGVFPSRN